LFGWQLGKSTYQLSIRLCWMTTGIHSGKSSLAAVRSVTVPLGERAYDVLIGPGLLSQSGRLIGARLGAARCGVVTDENVAGYYLEALEAALQHDVEYVGATVLRPGEKSKSFRELEPLSERLLEMGLERGDLVVAFGGGVIGDLAGFAAAILRRGVRFVQIPTSLLAQVDSSVGGKTGIDTPQGKNLIGAFHQPSLVIADPNMLKTLPEREMRAGYAEVAKYGLLGDAEFFAWLEKNWHGVFAFDVDPLSHAIETSVKAKAGIVGRDETEVGERALLNLGHTFGHAFEAWCGYSDRLLHGEAIAIGMCLAFRFSEVLGSCSKGDAERVVAHFQEVGLPTRVADIPGDKPDVQMLLRLMRQDKKVQHGKLTFILARGIGSAYIAHGMAPERVTTFLEGEISS
jgi:3-dehydroquinate synthase